MKTLKKGVFFYLAFCLLGTLSVSCDGDKPEKTYDCDGYGMCVQRTSGYACPESRCGYNSSNNTAIAASATSVFDCLDESLVAPSTMTIVFSYQASANSGCYTRPNFAVTNGIDTQSFSFDCHASGKSSISIDISAAQTIDDINFSLFSGDWAAWVGIESITFTP